MKRKKTNIIKNVALICAITLIALLPLPIAEAASFTVSKTNVTVDTGESTTITISASTHTGRIDIISSNPSVAEVNEKSLWVENNSKTITISAKSAGTAKIIIKGELFDAATDEEREYSQTVNVTVKASNSSSNSTGGNVSGGTNGNTGGTQSGNISSGSNSNQNSNSNTTSSSSKPITNTTSNSNKPSSSTTSSLNKPNSNNTSSTSTPSHSNSSTSPSNNLAQNNTTVIDNEIETVGEDLEQIEEIESTNITEELSQEEAEIEENLNVETLKNAELSNKEGANSTGKIILIGLIGAIAIAMIFIGIGVSKNILKK